MEDRRNRCLRCDNTSWEPTWRVKWMTARPSGIPQNHSRRAESEEQAVEWMNELADQAEAVPGSVFGIELVPEMQRCTCMQKACPDAPEGSGLRESMERSHGEPGARISEAVSETGSSTKKEFMDRKTVSAGDRE